MEMNDKTKGLLIRGNHVVLTPTEWASRRTKNRLSEHGKKGFIVRQGPRESVLFPGKLVALFESVTNSVSGNRNWLGWIDITEINIIEGEM
jgi:hypothetical protein